MKARSILMKPNVHQTGNIICHWVILHLARLTLCWPLFMHPRRCTSLPALLHAHSHMQVSWLPALLPLPLLHAHARLLSPVSCPVLISPLPTVLSNNLHLLCLPLNQARRSLYPLHSGSVLSRRLRDCMRSASLHAKGNKPLRVSRAQSRQGSQVRSKGRR
jgi:hypothetical protein